jgi:hypothetical protein
MEGKADLQGAGEPRPGTEQGWFHAPDSRDMLTHTKEIERHNGPEEVSHRTSRYTDINEKDKYELTAKAKVTIVDPDGKPMTEAKGEFKEHNYAGPYTVGSKQADADGKTLMTAGKGDILVRASRDGKVGESKQSNGQDNA